MLNFRILLLGILLAFVSSCISTKNYSNALDFALDSKNKNLQTVLKSPENYQVQILFAEIDRSSTSIHIKEHSFRLDDDNYFYPASTIKFPIAVMSLEKLNRLGIDYRSTYKLANDTLNTSFKQTIQQIFAVSDNLAFNRLYEFLGRDTINETIKSKGINKFRIAHRLSTPMANRIERTSLVLSPEQSNEIQFDFENDKHSSPLKIKNLKKGTGFMHKESIIYEPFDFSLKNYYPISSQYQILKRVIFPQLYSKEERFNLSDSQRQFLLNSMSGYPRTMGYHPKTYYDSYVKFFLFGESKKRIPKQFKIYNKVGYAYGTLTDCAYITDSKTGVEFMLVATILVNENQLFNDNNYQYNQVGIPFLSSLGKEIYRYEKNRLRIKKNR